MKYEISVTQKEMDDLFQSGMIQIIANVILFVDMLIAINFFCILQKFTTALV